MKVSIKKEVFKMEMFKIILFIPLLFLFSLFLAFTIRKRIIEKIMFIDDNLKDLVPWDFFTIY